MQEVQKVISPHRRKKVMISTLYPLGGNYGGLMQAYALQRTISDLGFNAVTINSSRSFSKTRSYLRLTRHYIKKMCRLNPGPLPLSNRLEKIQQTLPRQFVSAHISTIDFFGLSRKDKRTYLQNLDAIVVGSDQVWRNGYANVKKQLLDYAADFPLQKLSYAASFGGDKLIGYSPSLVKESTNLVSKFSAISVREYSGIKLCQNAWGVEAVQHVDPTLLLSRDIYESLFHLDVDSSDKTTGGLFFYVLDDSPWIKNFSQEAARKLHLNFFSILPELPETGSQIRKNASDYTMRSVQEWLHSFAKSDFVITDSFHGTLFSIIFNKPFLVIGNNKRGLSRFESILSTFRLESRLLEIGDEISLESLEPIDWKSVNLTLSYERERAIKYLAYQLAEGAHSAPK